jgi:hypothetical protein
VLCGLLSLRKKKARISMNVKWVCIASSIVLLIGVLNWPYGYYIFLRWVICFSSLFVAYHFFKIAKPPLMILFGMTAALFNPINPLFMDRQSWSLFDLLGSALFISAIFLLKKGK